MNPVNEKGELAEEDFQKLMQTGTRDELLQAALTVNPNDERARLLIRRWNELK